MTRATREMRNLLTLALMVGLGTGCSLVVSFDRTRVTDAGGGTDAGPDDNDAGMDGGIDAGQDDAGVDGGPPPCGNGMMDAGEQCDDANTTAGDGCSDTCEMEAGFNCTGAGADSCTEICGDSMVVGDEVCDDGNETACGDCNADCSATGSAVTCGDGAVCADSEACDDMGTDDGDGCSADCTMVETGFVCSMEPSVCAMTCGNMVLDAGEECDDGANADGDGCSAACVMEAGWSCMGAPSTCTTVCGDMIIVAGEEDCDDGGMATGDGCDDMCALEAGWSCTGTPSNCTEDCGDGMMVGAEVCDDGNTMTEAACPYGMATCMACNDTCTMALSLAGNVCGDGAIDAMNETCDDTNTTADDGCSAACATETGFTCMMEPSVCTANCGDGMMLGAEACDDSNVVDETECAYGTATCTGCNADCSMVLNLTGNVCGDGDVDAMNETCDDGNTSTCGLCARNCGTVQPAAAATGSITAVRGNQLDDARVFVISDGTTTVTFEFDITMTVTGGNVAIPYVTGTSADDLAIVIRDAINGSALRITAAIGTTPVVDLTADDNGEPGNVDITEDVDDAGFVVAGMVGGAGRTCGTGLGCTAADDCESGTCTGGPPGMCM